MSKDKKLSADSLLAQVKAVKFLSPQVTFNFPSDDNPLLKIIAKRFSTEEYNNVFYKARIDTIGVSETVEQRTIEIGIAANRHFFELLKKYIISWEGALEWNDELKESFFSSREFADIQTLGGCYHAALLEEKANAEKKSQAAS